MPDAPDPVDVELLDRYLATRVVPCPECGYQLGTGIRGACPECGVPLRLHLHPVRRKPPRLYSFGEAGLVTGLFISVALAVALFFAGRGPGPLLLLPLAALGIDFVALLLWGNRVLRLYWRDREKARLLAWACWLIPAWFGSWTAYLALRFFL